MVLSFILWWVWPKGLVQPRGWIWLESALLCGGSKRWWVVLLNILAMTVVRGFILIEMALICSCLVFLPIVTSRSLLVEFIVI